MTKTRGAAAARFSRSPTETGTRTSSMKSFATQSIRPPMRQEVTAEEDSSRLFFLDRSKERVVAIETAVQVGDEETVAAHYRQGRRTTTLSVSPLIVCSRTTAAVSSRSKTT